jgi:hypothetical protein
MERKDHQHEKPCAPVRVVDCRVRVATRSADVLLERVILIGSKNARRARVYASASSRTSRLTIQQRKASRAKHAGWWSVNRKRFSRSIDKHQARNIGAKAHQQSASTRTQRADHAEDAAVLLPYLSLA